MYPLLQMVWGPFNAVFLPLWESGKRVAVQYSGVGSVSSHHTYLLRAIPNPQPLWLANSQPRPI